MTSEIMSEPSMYLLLRKRDGTARKARLYVQGIEDFFCAMVLDQDESPPERGQLKGTCFFDKSVEEAKTEALRFVGHT